MHDWGETRAMSSLRHEVEKVVYTALKDIGVPDAKASPGAALLDIMVDEDATFWFVPQVERLLNLKIPVAEWERAITVSDSIEMLERYLSQARAHPTR
jgi:hypothetical protein